MEKILLLTLILTCNLLKAQTCFWSKHFEGNYNESAQSIITDTAGNIYATGYFTGTVDFDPGPGVTSITATFSVSTGFVMKMDDNGDLVWVKTFGSGNPVDSKSIALDNAGNIYVAGMFQSITDFDPGVGVFTMNALAGSDGFVLKLNSAGDFSWAKAISSGATGIAQSVATDKIGNVYIAGSFQGTADMDPDTTVSFNITASGNDLFITKLDTAGIFVWAKSVGSAGNSIDNNHIAVDSIGNVYAAGRFLITADFNPGAAVNNLTSAGNQDIYLLKLDASGNYSFAKSMGAANNDYANSIALDPSGNILFTGKFQNTFDFDPSAGSAVLTATTWDVFICKFDNAGNFTWVKQLSGVGNAYGTAITSDVDGNVYTMGNFEGNLDVNPGAASLTLVAASSGYADGFVSKLDPSGNFMLAYALNGGLDDYADAITINLSKDIILSARFSGWADVDPYPSTSLIINPVGFFDFYITKINDAMTLSTSASAVSCYGGSDGTASVVTAGGYTPYTYAWNTSGTTSTIAALTAATYTVTVTDNVGCSSTASVIVSQPPADSSNICMVSTDSISQFNTVVWDKTSFTSVDTFVVYREITTGSYMPIGAVPYDSLSQFKDTTYYLYFPNTGDPNSGSYRYKINTISNCGTTGIMSPYHNTIFITNSAGTFSWAALYTIEGSASPVSSYDLMRDDSTNGNWNVVASVAGTSLTISDPMYSIYALTASWRVRTVWSITCSPTRISSTSYSNIVTNVVSAVQEQLLSNTLQIFPNPSNGLFHIQTGTKENVQIEIYNMLGAKQFAKQINGNDNYTLDLSSLPEGIYSIRFLSEKESFVKKVVKE